MIRLFILIIFLQFIYSNEQSDKIIKHIKNGTFDFNSNINNNLSESLFIKGMIELNGNKSKDYFLEFYNKYPDNKYADDSVVKIAEYFYSMGYYVKSGKWYKKIPIKYPDSEHLEKSISYYLNSLIIVGESDSAKYYTKEFKKKYPKLKFNNSFIKDDETVKSVKTNIIEEYPVYAMQSRFSIQIGAYENYQTALSKKRMLSSEGFLGRIDEISLDGKKLYSVRIGSYKKKLSAEKELNRLKSRLGIYDSIIIKVQ